MQKRTSNVSSQVWEISEVMQAVVNRDLNHMVDVQAERRELKTTVSQMVFCLSTLAGEVTCVSRKVGTEGKTGGTTVDPRVQ